MPRSLRPAHSLVMCEAAVECVFFSPHGLVSVGKFGSRVCWVLVVLGVKVGVRYVGYWVCWELGVLVMGRMDVCCVGEPGTEGRIQLKTLSNGVV